jgi:transcription factor 1
MDARQGGRMDPRRLKVRNMNEEMLAGLVKAFLEWPFRPSNVEMALASEWAEAPSEGETDV